MSDQDILPPEEMPQEEKPSFLRRSLAFILPILRRILSTITFMFRLDSILSVGFLLFIILSFTIFIIWASFFQLEKTVKAPGVVLAVIENQVISHLEGGIIEDVYVSSGEKIKAGQDLMKIDNIDVNRERANLLIRQQYLKAVLLRLQAEVSQDAVLKFEEMKDDNTDLQQQYRIFLQNRSTFERKIDILETQKEKIESEIEGTRIHLENLQEEYKIASEQVDIISPLVKKGVGSTQLLLQRKADMARNKTALSESNEKLKTLQLSLQESFEKIEEESVNYLQVIQEEIGSTTNELDTTTSDLESLSSSVKRNILRSPVSGTVFRILNTTTGGVVRAGDALIEIVPDEGSIRVEAKVQPQDRAHIYLGQKAKIRPSVYSFSLDTMLITKIVSISPQTFFDDVTRSYYYKVFLEADIASNEHEKESGQLIKNFLPGMIVEVNIISGEESLMNYFLTPIMRGLNNSLTERSTR